MKENKTVAKTTAKIVAKTATKTLKELVLDYDVTSVPAAIKGRKSYGVREQLIATFVESGKPCAVIHCDDDKSANVYTCSFIRARHRRGYKISINKRGTDLYLTNLEVEAE